MNSSKTSSSKTSRQTRTAKNTVGVQNVGGMIRLSLPREVSRAAYGVAQKFIFPGLQATPLNLKLIQSKADQISVDIATGNFDITWQKYQLGVVAANKLTAIDGGKKKPEMSLLELYNRYCDSRKGSVAETTMELSFRGVHKRAITEAVEIVGEDALKIREYLIENRCARTAQDCLRYLSKAHQLGIKHEYVNKNPFEGMAEEIQVTKGKKNKYQNDEEDSETKAFSIDEMNAIIEAFEFSRHRKHLAPIIKFLFWTGCRTGEAIGLKWRDIKWDKELITFRRTYNKSLNLFKPTKTNTIRFFPMHKDEQLWNLLKSIPEKDADDVVFTSKNGKIIDSIGLWKIWAGQARERHPGVIPQLIAQGKVKEYLRLYATRHTFISHQVNVYKIPITTVAQWVGNAAMVSNNSYLDRDRITVPGYSQVSTQAPVDPIPKTTTGNQSSDAMADFIASLTPEQKKQLRKLLTADE